MKRHSLLLGVRTIFACIMLSSPVCIQAQELGATFSATTRTGVVMTFQLVDTVEMNIQVGTWDGLPAIDIGTQGQVIIPNTAGGMKVVAIAPGAFNGCAGVTAINVPTNVASIGERAFAGMSSLDTLVVSSSNPVFDSRNDCNAVVETATNTLIVGCRSSVIDPTVTAIGPSAFEGSGITSVVLSSDITAIGERAFASCASLTAITSLSSTPFAVNPNCFSNQADVELYVPLGCKATYLDTEGWNSIEHIYEIGAPTEFADNQGVCYMPHYLDGSYVYSVARLNEEHSSEIVIPSVLNDYPVTSIGDTAFAYRPNLSTVTIPASIESIGDQAFVGCNGLYSLTMLKTEPPATAITAFDNFDEVMLSVPLGSRTVYASVEPWSYFTKVDVLNAPEEIFADGVFYNPVADGDVYTYTITGHEDGISTINLLSDVGGYPVTAIAPEAFKGCTSLTGTLILPSSLVYIGDHAFMGCTGITSSVNIPAGVTEIGINPFAGCTGISAFSVDASNSVYDARNNSNAIVHTATNTLVAGSKGSQFPDDITAIAPYAFYGQTSMLGITIPEGVSTIGEWAFYGCDQITQVRILAPVPPAISENVFSCYDTARLSVVKGNKAAYAEANGWQEFAQISEIGVPDEYHDSQGIDYTPYEVGDIYVYAVTGHQSAMPANITIPEYINGHSVERIEANVFNGCRTLFTITLPDNMLFIGDSAFMNCPNMTSVNIPSLAQSIGQNAFSGCNHLHSIAIPAATTYIGGNAFYGCSALETITVEAGNQMYDSREGCNALIETGTNTLLYGSGSTIIPSTVTAIAANAFRSNTVLTSVTIPANVTSIGANAFNGCNAMTEVNCEAMTPPSISEGTFTNLNYLTLNVPLGTKSLYAEAPVWKDFSAIEDGAPIDPDYYQLAYIVDGDTISTSLLIEGMSITPLAEPIKEGSSFSGWSEIPDTMPAHDVTVTGSFAINSYKLTYIVDGDTLQREQFVYATAIEPIEDQTREGYTFSGWSEIPATMPAHDVTVTGSFAINSYKLTYIVDGDTLQREQVVYATAIEPIEDQTREGYTFSGWSEIPATMPAADLTITGSFTINSYKLTYIVDGEEYKTDSVIFASAIEPEQIPEKEGYTFSGWGEVPDSMPAHDVTINGSFTPNSYLLTYIVDGEEYKADSIVYATDMNAEPLPEKEGYTFSGWSAIPATMPAHDVIVTGSFAINGYKLTYIVDGEDYKSDSLIYASAIEPEPLPENEGHTFSGWSEIPTTMPAHDVIINGSFTPNSYLLTYIVDGKTIQSNNVVFATTITPLAEPIKEGYTFSGWSEIPATMPAHDVTITGMFTVIETYETEDAVLAYDEEKGGYEFTGTKDTETMETTVPDEVNGIPVVSVPEGAFVNETQLQVLTWDNPAPVENTYFAAPEEHGNLLVFVTSDTAIVTYEGNVVRNGIAEKVTLYDGRPMTNPRLFKAEHISITKEFGKETIIGSTSGWETIVVPFDVDSITTEDGQLIAPFGSDANTDKHFWLAKMDATDGFLKVSQIRANVPYIISMPNSEQYIEEYRISGKITFHGTNVDVQPTANATSSAGPLFGLVPTYQEVAAADSVFVLNDEQYEADGITWPAGSVFVRSSRAARPFEAYTYANASNGGNVKSYIRLDEMATGLQQILNAECTMHNAAGAVYDLSGRRIAGSGSLKKGLYIESGQKVLVK